VLRWEHGTLLSREDGGRIRQLIPKPREGRHPAPDRSRHPLIRRVHARLHDPDAAVPWRWLDTGSLTEFQGRVLRAVARIPPGETRSYGAVARQIDCGGGARAVGQALRRNPFPLLIPCHRVIRADGTAGGFGGRASCDLKRRLLAGEGAKY